MNAPSATAPRPGYLVVGVDGDGTYAGGLMVTDEAGLPLDFRYTDPITPTRLQRALYGGALDRYLKADVVARTLLKAVEQPPTVLLVEDEHLLDALAAECPVAMVAGTRQPSIGPPGTVRADPPARLLVQAADGDGPLRVTLADDRAGEGIAAALVELGRRMDPLEPAERVRAALGLIAAGDRG
jgi:hypothetical protein